MRKFLAHDAETGELRLVYTDLWDGQHERTEYRVTGGRGGGVLRNHADLDGREVFGTVPGLFIKSPRRHADPGVDRGGCHRPDSEDAMPASGIQVGPREVRAVRR